MLFNSIKEILNTCMLFGISKKRTTTHPYLLVNCRLKLDRLKEVFRGDNSFAKFDALTEMMVLISRYLSNNNQSMNVGGVEILNLSVGCFLAPRKSKANTNDQPKNPLIKYFVYQPKN